MGRETRRYPRPGVAAAGSDSATSIDPNVKVLIYPNVLIDPNVLIGPNCKDAY